MPKITIITPAYNIERYIARAVQSVLDQSLQDFELIVVDDASTDSTPFILRKFAAADSRVRLIELDKNGGQGAARNLALKQAKGEAVMFLDGDDYFAAGALQKAYDALISGGDDLVKFGLNYVSINGTSYDAASMKPFAGALNGAKFKPNINLRELGGNFFVTYYHCTIIYKRSFLELNDIWYGDGRVGEDTKFYVKALFKAKTIGVLDEPLYNYYQHGESTMAKAAKNYTQSLQKRAEMFELLRGDDIFLNAHFHHFIDSNLYWLERYAREEPSVKRSLFAAVKCAFKRFATPPRVAHLQATNPALYTKFTRLLRFDCRNYFRILNGKKPKRFWIFNIRDF